MTFGEAPPDTCHPVPEEAKHLVMHANLMIAGSPVMFYDVFPGMPFTEGNNISLTVTDTDEEKIRLWFNKLKDKFGIHWQLSHDNGQNG